MKKPRYLIDHLYTADPAVHVFNDKLFIYPSHDIESGIPENDNGDHFDMRDYHVFSMETIDGPVKDYGVAIDVKDIPWAGRQLWDCDVAYKDGKYFLYFPLKDKTDVFHIGVAVSDKPEGPYYDFFGNDMAAIGDDFPIITARYGFRGHPGWQGFGHCGLLRDGNNYFYVSQARLSSNKYLMDLHIHRMVWTSDGWPVISPERFVNVPQTNITTDSIVGTWEHIDLTSTTTNNLSKVLEFRKDGTIDGISNSSWSFSNNELQLIFNGGETIIKSKIFHDWDWENKKVTICYSGLSQQGRSGWGKKISSN